VFFRWSLLVALTCAGAALSEAAGVLPAPQYMEPLRHSLTIAHAGHISIVIGPAGQSKNEKLKLAADYLRKGLLQADSSLRIEVEQAGPTHSENPSVFLWDYEADPSPQAGLNFLDRETLAGKAHFGQGYVVRTDNADSMWVIGSTGQGVLWGAMTVLQLIRQTGGGVELAGAYVRDYPDFQYRDSANWLMNGEGTRWSLDRGQGIDDYQRVCERKMDEALQFKINMITFDGFGWGLNRRFERYAELMRSLNQYARVRGISLVFGGYGAGYGFAYQTGPLYEAAPYLGKVFENRESYPNGPIYQCMGFPDPKARVDPGTLGTCRGNDELNKLKGEELRAFVQTVEPGALYIHHEDLGDYRETADVWQKRCSRCRHRWPNDSLLAKDGGAGALAHGYSALVQAVEDVKNPATGYDASRDCQIILVSPVYEPNSSSSEDWSNALELWKNIAEQLPDVNNLQVCFREVFSQEYGGETWVKSFNSAMADVGSHLGTYMFFLGGADNYTNASPLTGAPALNAEFFGARSIFNFSGNFFQEPMAAINAEYSWNTHSAGLSRKPSRHGEQVELWHRYIFEPDQPPEVFGSGGVYERACTLLYGARAAAAMAAYYRETAWVPDGGTDFESRDSAYLPMTFNRAYAVPEHWKDLALDSATWGPAITDITYATEFANLKVDRQELHRRLARRWSILAELNARAAKDVQDALNAGPRTTSIEDLQFLTMILQVDQTLMGALIDFHQGLRDYFASPQNAAQARSDFGKALVEATQARDMAEATFPQPIDPSGGEVGILRTHSARLVEAIRVMLDKV
jgi:hypothetical protein